MKTITFILSVLLVNALPLKAISLKGNLLFTSTLDAQQVLPSTNSSAKGVASLMMSKNRDSVTINMSLINLSSTITSVGLYYGSANVNGTLVMSLTTFLNGNKLTTDLTGLSVSNNRTKFFNEDLYILVTTSAYPNGEIRGQVKLETDISYTADLSGMSVIPTVLGSAYGVGAFSLSLSKEKLDYKIICQDMTGSITSAKLHYGSAAVNGAVAIDLSASISGNVISGSITPTSQLLDSLAKGHIYLNVSTANNSNGELRSQLIHHKGISFKVEGNGSEMVPPVSSSGKGLAILRLSSSLDTLYYDVIAAGLSTTLDYAHLHIGNFGLPYVNTSFEIDFTPTIIGYRTSGIITGFALTANNRILRLLTSNLALIFHTGLMPAGELRGQASRYAREGFTINMTGDQVVPSTTTSAYGSGFLSVSPNDANAHYVWQVGNLSAPASNAAFYNNKKGLTGPLLLDVSANTSILGNQAICSGFWKNTDIPAFLTSNSLQLSKDSVYLQLSNTTFPNGEIRGQVFSGYKSTNAINSDVSYTNTIFEEGIQTLPNPTHDMLHVKKKHN
jgi:hypothetical protein